MRGTSGLKTILFGVIVVSVWGALWAADIDVQNDDVRVTGQVTNNYTFKVGTIGRLLMDPGARQIGNITLERNAVIYSNGAFEIVRDDPGQGIVNTQLNLTGRELRVQSDLHPTEGADSPFFWIGNGQIVGAGSIVAPVHTVALIGGDSSGSSASISAMGMLIGVPDAWLPTGQFTVSNHIILSTLLDTGKDFHCTRPVALFANVDEGPGEDYEVHFTGQFQFDPNVDFVDIKGRHWGRGAAFTAPSRIQNPNQTTVTYYVGNQTFQLTDSLAVCGGIRGENGRVVYGTVKVDQLSWLQNAQGRYLNLGFAGGKLDLTSMPAGTVFDFQTNNIRIGSLSIMGHPGGGIFVLPNNSTLLLKADRILLDEGILEVQGNGLTVIVDCSDTMLTPEDFGGFKIPAGATLRFTNVQGDTIATGNLQGQGEVDAEGRNLAVGSDIEDRSAEPDDTKEFKGRIENVVELDKVGQGTTTLGEGAVVQAESAKVSEGTLVVKTDQFTLNGGSGTLEVNGGTLMGTGAIGGNLTIGPDGQYRPGCSINTQQILGDFSMQGTAEIEVRPLPAGTTQGTPGVDNDLIRVGGGAAFSAGARVRVTQDSDYIGVESYKTGDRYYFLLSESNRITGSSRLAFGDDLPGVHVADFGLTDPNTLLGALQGQWIWFELAEGDFFGNSPNTRAMAALMNRLLALGLLPDLTDDLLDLYGPEQLVVLQQMAGEGVGTSISMVLQNTTIVSDFLSRQVRPMFWSGGGDGGFSEVSGKGSAPIVWCGGPSCSRSCWTPWAVGYGLGGTFFSDGNTARTGVSTGGLLVGLDRTLACDTRAGLFYAYGRSSADLASLRAGINTDNHLWGGYLTREWLRSYVLAVGGVGYDQYDSRRIVGTDTFAESFRSNHGGWQGLVYGEYGLNLQTCALAVQPYFGLRYVHLRQEGFTERPTGLTTLAVEPVDLDSLRTQLGLRAGFRRPCGGGQALLEGRAAWVHELLDQTAAIYYASLAAAPGAGSFAAQGVDLGRDFAWLGVGLGWQITETLQIRGDYDLMFNDLHTLHTGSAAIVFQW